MQVSGEGSDQSKAEIWCRERELNSRPHPYQGCALPLSYRGIEFIERARYLKQNGLKTPKVNELSTMTEKSEKSKNAKAGESREDRLKAALRANLRRRKTAARKDKASQAVNTAPDSPHSDDTSSK